jgi:hypothetical protein
MFQIVRILQRICRCKLRSALYRTGLVLTLSVSSLAQNTATQTLNVAVFPRGALDLQTFPRPFTELGAVGELTGAITPGYRARTRHNTGQRKISAKVTSYFARAGGPAGQFTDSCSRETLDTACSGMQTVSTTKSPNVVSLGASACTGGGAPCSTANSNCYRLRREHLTPSIFTIRRPEPLGPLHDFRLNPHSATCACRG